MSYYFYILRGIDGYNYYGHTRNLTRRILEHSKGEVESTRKRRPVKLVYFEEISSRNEAFKREMQFKNGKTRKEAINKLINDFPKEKCQGFNSRI